MPKAKWLHNAENSQQDVGAGIASGRMRGTLDLYKASETENISIEGREIPLEIDETGPIAVGV